MHRVCHPPRPAQLAGLSSAPFQRAVAGLAPNGGRYLRNLPGGQYLNYRPPLLAVRYNLCGPDREHLKSLFFTWPWRARRGSRWPRWIRKSGEPETCSPGRRRRPVVERPRTDVLVEVLRLLQLPARWLYCLLPASRALVDALPGLAMAIRSCSRLVEGIRGLPEYEGETSVDILPLRRAAA